MLFSCDYDNKLPILLKITTKNEVQLECMTNISSEENLKFGEYWEINEKDLLKFWQKLENSVKTVV